MIEIKRVSETDVVIDMPPSEELMARLTESGLLIDGYPKTVCRNFVERIAGHQLSPKEIAANWVEARQDIMGNPISLSVSGILDRFLIGLHGVDVIRELIRDKRLADQTIHHLSSAYKEAAKQA